MTQRHFRKISNSSSSKKNPLFGDENVSCRLFCHVEVKTFLFPNVLAEEILIFLKQLSSQEINNMYKMCNKC